MGQALTTEKYQVHLEGENQGVVIGDHATVHQTFGVGERGLRGLRRSQAASLLGIGILLLGVFLPLLLGFDFRRDPAAQACMQGDFRVAVAAFADGEKPAPAGLGEQLAGNLALHLKEDLQALDPGLVIEVWGPEQAGSVTGQDREQRAQEAEDLARRICADLVVYGAVEDTGSAWQVTPEFSIFSDHLSEAHEVLGQHELGATVQANGVLLLRRSQLSDQIAGRVKALASLVVGLAYSQANQFDRALEILASPLQAPGSSMEGIQELLYLVMGNTASRAGRLAEAGDYYHAALRIQPEYARAMIGLGSVEYLLAIEPFSRTQNPLDADLVRLDTAMSWYERAAAVPNPPARADIAIKSQFGLGQCLLMREYAGGEAALRPAVAAFQAVIRSYEADQNPRVRELASESHARLGLIYRLAGQHAWVEAEYRKAAELAIDEQRAALYRQAADAAQIRAQATPSPTPTPQFPDPPPPPLTPTPGHSRPTPAIPMPEPTPNSFWLPGEIPALVIRQADLQAVDPNEVAEEVGYFEPGWVPDQGCQSALAPSLLAPSRYNVLSQASFLTCGWGSGELLTLLIERPDGEVSSEVVFYSSIRDGLMRKLPSGPGVQLGRYHLVVRGQSASVSADFYVSAPSGPGAYRLEDGRILIYGFQSGETVRVLLYPAEKNTQPLHARTFKMPAAGYVILVPGEGVFLNKIHLVSEKSGSFEISF